MNSHTGYIEKKRGNKLKKKTAHQRRKEFLNGISAKIEEASKPASEPIESSERGKTKSGTRKGLNRL